MTRSHLTVATFAAAFIVIIAMLAGDPARADGSLICLGGRVDDYSTADGLEPTTASNALETTLLGFPDHPPRRQFDQCVRNYVFAHTLSGCALDSNVTQAILTLRLRGTPSGETYSDRLVLGSGGTLRWGMSMNALQALRTGGADTQWRSTDSATFVLDLGNLPPSEGSPSGWPSWSAGTTNILPFLAAGHDLDLLLRDDTCVDYLTLTVSSPTPARSSTWGEIKARYR